MHREIMRWDWNLPNDRRLTKENWMDWRSMLQSELVSLGIMDTAHASRLSLKYQHKIRGQILRNLTPTISQMVIHDMDFNALWRTLSSLENTVVTSVAAELTKFYTLECGDDPEEYITKVQTSHSTLASLGSPIADTEKVQLFLKGISNRYSYFHQAIYYRITKMSDQKEALEELIGEFRSMLMLKKAAKPREREQNNTHNRRRGGAKGFESKAENSNSNSSTKRYDGDCTHCKMKGHRETDCWRLHPEKKPKMSSSRSRTPKIKEEANAVITTTTNVPTKSFVLFNLIEEHIVTRTTSTYNRNRWIFDTGASVHVVNDRGWFNGDLKSTSRYSSSMTGAGPAKVQGIGTVKLVVTNDKEKSELVLSDALNCPQFPVNIFSAQRLYEKGGKLYGLLMVIPDGNGGLYIATQLNPNFEMNIEECSNLKDEEIAEANTVIPANFVYATDEIEPENATPIPTDDEKAELNRLWHRRLAHAGQRGIIESKKITTGLEDLKPLDTACADCDVAKSLRYRPKDRRMREAQAGIGFHFDVVICKPIAWDNTQYIIAGTDDATRFRIARNLKRKFEGAKVAIEILKVFTNLTGFDPDWITIDNGNDCNFGEFTVYCKDKGIDIKPSPPYEQAKNGVAERTWRTVFDRVRAVKRDMKIPPEIWAEAFMAVIYVVNRTFTTALKGKTPWEAFFDDIGKPGPNKPDISNLRVIGCRAIVNKPPELRQVAFKADVSERAWEGILVGYQGSHLYRIWNPAKKAVIVTGQVVFYEPRGLEPPVFRSVPRGTFRNKQIKSTKKRPETDREHDDNEAIASLALNTWQAATKGGDQWMNTFAAARTSFDYIFVAHGPSSAKKAVAINGKEGQIWRALIYAEIQQLLDRNVLEFDQPNNQRKITTRFALTRRPNGEPKKARLVARGFQQLQGIDYHETYASTARSASWRILCALATINDWKVRQVDVVGAYLTAELKEIIFVEKIDLLDEYFADHPAEAAKRNWNGPRSSIQLKKALYGLKQAGHEWQLKLKSTLAKLGIKPLQSDPAVYQGNGLIATTHVDDLLLFSKDRRQLINFEEQLASEMDLKIQGEPDVFLGVEIDCTQSDQLKLSQVQYTAEIIDRFGLTDARTVATPADEGIYRAKNDKRTRGRKLIGPEITQYQAMVGALMFLATNTRPDLAFIVGYLARSMAEPYAADEAAIKRTLRYARTPLSITYEAGDPVNRLVLGYCDADWAGDPDDTADSKSTSGYVFYMAGGPVSWGSRRQSVVARSTAEAEYYAAGSAAAEASWIREFLTEIAEGPEDPIKLRTDNQATIKIIGSEQISARTRHIRIQYHFVRQEARDRRISIEYVPTNDQAADVMTKPLGRVKHTRSLAQLGLEPAG